MQKVAAGLLYETIVHRVPAGDPRWPTGESRIIVTRTHNRQHIGTRHEIVLPDGSVPHSHPKDYTLRDCSRVRAP